MFVWSIGGSLPSHIFWPIMCILLASLFETFGLPALNVHTQRLGLFTPTPRQREVLLQCFFIALALPPLIMAFVVYSFRFTFKVLNLNGHRPNEILTWTTQVLVNGVRLSVPLRYGFYPQPLKNHSVVNSFQCFPTYMPTIYIVSIPNSVSSNIVTSFPYLSYFLPMAICTSLGR